MPIIVMRGDITKIKCDAIVNPANSSCTMNGGAALAIKKAGGAEIEKEAMRKAPIAVGSAVATSSGKLPCKYVIHAPTMTKPVERISAANVRKATVAAMRLASRMKLESIAMPGMGTGVGGVDKEEAAKAMIEEIKKYPQVKVYLVAKGEELHKAFRKYASAC